MPGHRILSHFRSKDDVIKNGTSIKSSIYSNLKYGRIIPHSEHFHELIMNYNITISLKLCIIYNYNLKADLKMWKLICRI